MEAIKVIKYPEIITIVKDHISECHITDNAGWHVCECEFSFECPTCNGYIVKLSGNDIMSGHTNKSCKKCKDKGLGYSYFPKEVMMDKITLDPDKVKEVMAQRGYSLHSHSGNNTSFNFTKIVDEDTIIHSRVWLDDMQMDLSTIDGVLTITTGKFSFNHPGFERVFESPVIRAARILK